MSDLFSRKHDSLSTQYQSNGSISINKYQYPNKSPPINVMVKRGTKIREIIRNPKTKKVTRVTLQVHMSNILQQLKNPPLLVEGQVSVLMFWRQMYSCSVHHILWKTFQEHTPCMMMISGVALTPVTSLLTQRIVKK